MDVESYEAELAEFRRQLQEDRRGLNEEIRQLRARTLALDEAASAMEAQLAQEQARLSQERGELDRLRDEVGQQLAQGAPAGSERHTVLRRFQETMTAAADPQPGTPRPGEKRNSNGRGYRVLAPRRGNGSGSAGR
jgi:chromosome segregation ATPase